jgi:hypothetical protein
VGPVGLEPTRFGLKARHGESEKGLVERFRQVPLDVRCPQVHTVFHTELQQPVTYGIGAASESKELCQQDPAHIAGYGRPWSTVVAVMPIDEVGARRLRSPNYVKGVTMRRIPVLLLVALLAIGLVPIAANAATAEETAAIAALQEALDGIECITVEGCIEEIAEVKAALAALRALFPDLDYAALDAAIADLEAAIEGGDLDAIKAAADAVSAAGAAVAADAAAAADAEDTTTTTVAAPTAVDTGSPVDSGPNVALLGVAALLVLLASGAFVLRLTADRR